MIIFYDKRDGRIISTIFGRVHTDGELRPDIIQVPDVPPEYLERKVLDIQETTEVENYIGEQSNVSIYKVDVNKSDGLFTLIPADVIPEPQADAVETIVIDLTQEIDVIMSGFSETTQKYIRQSESLSFREIGFNDRKLVLDVLKEIEDLKDIELYTQMLRVRAPFLDGLRRMYIVEENGKVLASAVINTIGDRFTYVLGGVTVEGREKHAGDRLVWGLIQDAKELGYKIYDLGGIYADWASDEKKTVNTFKERWGGVKAPLDVSNKKAL